MVAIFVVALLLFGPKELPKLGRTIGKAMTEFRRAQSELKTTFNREMQNLERETGIKELTATTFNSNSYNYDQHRLTTLRTTTARTIPPPPQPKPTAHPQLRAPAIQHCRLKGQPARSRAATWMPTPEKTPAKTTRTPGLLTIPPNPHPLHTVTPPSRRIPRTNRSTAKAGNGIIRRPEGS